MAKLYQSIAEGFKTQLLGQLGTSNFKDTFTNVDAILKDLPLWLIDQEVIYVGHFLYMCTQTLVICHTPQQLGDLRCNTGVPLSIILLLCHSHVAKHIIFYRDI